MKSYSTAYVLAHSLHFAKCVIVMTHCELDLVEHTLIDPKTCKFGDVIRIGMTLPIASVGAQMGRRSCV